MSDIKDVLKEIREGRFEVKELEAHKQSLASKRLPGGLAYDKDKVKSSRDDKISALTAVIDEVDQELSSHIKDITDQELQCIKVIKKVKKADYRRLLYLRYIDDEPKSWAKIAEILGYSESDIKRKHGYALEEIRRYWKP